MSKSIECIIELKSGNDCLKIVSHLVRCKNCVYWQDDLCSFKPDWHYCAMNNTDFRANDYCSRGEERILTKKSETPCFKCTDRTPGCHSTCERYIDFKENGNGYKNRISENKNKYYTIEAFERWRARRKHEQFRRRDGKKV